VILRNPRTGAVLADRMRRAASFLARLRGLVGQRAIADGEGLLIERCNAIHTFFMRFAIDAVFLSPDLRVLRTLPDLRPWRATRFERGATMVVELPRGTLLRTGTREGDLLQTDATQP
jgi:uncharacterized membrane protein (UPF0127 family)